ncbi:MAG: hypothetical protein ABW252_16740 [Polyangiales bacterium]
MKLSPLVLAGVLAGCARSSVAALVPQLDLSVRLVRARVHTRDAVHTDLVLGAWLRWEPLVPDAAAGSALSAAAMITPCEVDDPACLTEHAESEPEIARLRVEAP